MKAANGPEETLLRLFYKKGVLLLTYIRIKNLNGCF